jgi:hypothetical protein
MNPTVTKVEPLGNYKLKVEFANGDARIFDVGPYLDKGIFTQLKDEHYFRKVRVAFGSIAWPDDQDFSKDTLYLLGQPL